MDIAARGFSAFDNFMPDHHGDIDLDAHHYQARTRTSVSGACRKRAGVICDMAVFWGGKWVE